VDSAGEDGVRRTRTLRGAVKRSPFATYLSTAAESDRGKEGEAVGVEKKDDERTIRGRKTAGGRRKRGNW